MTICCLYEKARLKDAIICRNWFYICLGKKAIFHSVEYIVYNFCTYVWLYAVSWEQVCDFHQTLKCLSNDPPPKKVKAHCLKLNLRSALKIVLPHLLSPVESVNLLKLHRSQHWDTFPLVLLTHPHPPFCTMFILSASLSFTNFLLYLFIS